MQKGITITFLDTKPHYELLSGLGGVAALMVIWYHIFEGFATSPMDQRFNHGYLAIDFFFILPGFVIGYAYDDRWETMKTKDFSKCRLIRLYPMVVPGAVLGSTMFYIQDCEKQDSSWVSISMIMLAILMGTFLIPVVPGAGSEARGNGETYPSNDPSWSLFFEYIGDILYALFICKLSAKALAVPAVLVGIGLAPFAIFNFSGYSRLGVGWLMADYNLIGGFLYLLFSFFIGLLMIRVFKPLQVEGALWTCSLAITALLSMSYIGGSELPWINSIYDSACATIILPLPVYLGAPGKTTDKKLSKIYEFLGNISYLLHTVRYPFMYLFYVWVWSKEPNFSQAWPMALVVLFGNILLAYLCLKFYDEPARRWLTKEFLAKK